MSNMVSREIEEQTRDVNTYTLVGEKLAFRATGHRVIVAEDRFRTGYECKTCDGIGYTEKDCPNCKGTRIEKAVREDLEDAPCRVCVQDGRSTGKEVCVDCKGRGALLIAPENSKRRVTTGTVTSCGPDCEVFKVGDRVVYTLYAGTKVEFKQKEAMIFMEEQEILGMVFGQGNLGDAVV